MGGSPPGSRIPRQVRRSPLPGRWLSRDPSGLDGGVDVYSYCEGDPVSQVDPTGLDRFTIILGDTVNFIDGGEQAVMLGQVKNWLRANGHSYDVIGSRDRDKAVLRVSHSDSFVFIGHGTDDGGTIAPNTTDSNGWVLDDSFMRDAVDLRHGDGFDRIWMFGCKTRPQRNVFSPYCNIYKGFDNGLNMWKSKWYLLCVGSDERFDVQHKRVSGWKPPKGRRPRNKKSYIRWPHL